MHGERKILDFSGTLKFSENYFEGKKHGEQIKFSENGAKEYVENYKHGIILDKFFHLKGGEIYYRAVYENGIHKYNTEK